MRETAPLGRTGQDVFLFRMVAMQRIIKTRQHPRGIAESGMLGDVRYPFAIDPHFAAVVEAVEKFRASVGQQPVHVCCLPAKGHTALWGAMLRLLRQTVNDVWRRENGETHGQVALITGAAGGQGAAEAELFVREEGAVVLTDIDTTTARRWCSDSAARAAMPCSCGRTSP